MAVYEVNRRMSVYSTHARHATPHRWQVQGARRLTWPGSGRKLIGLMTRAQAAKRERTLETWAKAWKRLDKQIMPLLARHAVWVRARDDRAPFPGVQAEAEALSLAFGELLDRYRLELEPLEPPRTEIEDIGRTTLHLFMGMSVAYQRYLEQLSQHSHDYRQHDGMAARALGHRLQVIGALEAAAEQIARPVDSLTEALGDAVAALERAREIAVDEEAGDVLVRALVTSRDFMASQAHRRVLPARGMR
jgi:hypothetical protein